MGDVDSYFMLFFDNLSSRGPRATRPRPGGPPRAFPGPAAERLRNRREGLPGRPQRSRGGIATLQI